MASQHHRLVLILVRTTSLICQTLFYGIYAALIPFSTLFLLKRKSMTRANKLMFSITIFMFLLSTGYWISSVGNEFSTLVVFFSSSPDRITTWMNLAILFNSLSLVNYALTDCVVVWRAWVLCKDGSKKILMVPSVLLCFTFLSILATIGIRVTMTITGDNLDPIIDVTQMVNLVLSLLTNISATSIIGFRAWQHRREIREAVSKERGSQSKVERILVLLVESGFIYCVSGLFVLFASFIRLPHGTLGDIYTPVHTQIAGIYPTVVLVLVSQKRSLKEGAFSTVGNATAVVATQIESMNFGTNPAIESSAIFQNDELSDEDELGGSARSSEEQEVYSGPPKGQLGN